MKAARIAAALALAVALLGTAGCVRERITGDNTTSLGSAAGVETFEKTVSLNGATAVHADLDMGVGELQLRGGATSDLMDGEFEYRPASWKPDVTYAVDGTTGNLSVAQPAVKVGSLGNNKNTWRLRFADAVPLDVNVKLGAGESDLDFSTLDLRHLTMALGAGETHVDLTGARTESVTGDIRAGVGELTIVLPRDIGARVVGKRQGIGTWRVAPGLKAEGNAYVNDAYGTTPVSIEIDVVRGIGDVNLELGR